MGAVNRGNGVVVSMHRNAGAVPPPQFAQVEAYWNALRPDDGGLPRRADLDPRGMSDHLHHILLLERIAPGQVRIRLAGTAVCDLMGMDLRGMPLSALVVPQSRPVLDRQIERVFTPPARLELSFEGEKTLMRPPLLARMLLLPLLGHNGVTDRALACLVAEGKIGRTPRRLVLKGTGAPADFLRTTVQAGFAEAPAAFAPAQPQPSPTKPGLPPYLRLVKG